MAGPLEISVVLNAVDKMTAPARAAMGAYQQLADAVTSQRMTRQRLVDAPGAVLGRPAFAAAAPPLSASARRGLGAAAAQEVIDEIRDHLSGANMVPSAMEKLFPDLDPSDWPVYQKVEKDAVYLLTKKHAIPLKPPPPNFRNHGNYVTSVSKLSRFLADRAEEAGAYLLTETVADKLLVEDRIVRGVRSGDKIAIYMPMIPEAAIAMLACARIGAVHSVVFGGFAAKELATRIEDAKPKLILSASCGIEPGRIVTYKPLLDEAIRLASYKPPACMILQRPQCEAPLTKGRDHDWQAIVDIARSHGRRAECVAVAATDPLYILYTSGTTGQPKRSTHASAMPVATPVAPPIGEVAVTVGGVVSLKMVAVPL